MLVEVLIKPTLRVGFARPLSQLGVGLALRLFGLALGIRPMAGFELD